MNKSTRRSSVVGRSSVGNFSTRFSLPSFVKRVNKLTNSQRNAITRMGFGNVLQIPNLMLCKNLLVELMERWSCEKHAFLLIPGNITITLMDVSLILGLRVTGDPVILKEDAPFSDLEREYGASLWNRKITIASIEKRLESLGCIDDEDFIRSFLLYLFGALLFPNTTEKVDSRYLSLLWDLDKVSCYAWGAAVLADVFNWLCKRKETQVQYIGGCLILLQLPGKLARVVLARTPESHIWCYEHIDIARPTLLRCSLSVPRACRWGNIKRGNIRSLGREWFITKFKELRSSQIIWELEPTCLEAEVDIVKELLEARGDKRERYYPRSSSTNDSIDNEKDLLIQTEILEPSVVDVESGSEMHLVREVPGVEEDNSMELTPTLNASIALTNIVQQMNHPWTPHCTSRIVVISDDDEDDRSTNTWILEEKIIKLKKENDDLRKENELLKNKLFSSPNFEEQNVDLRKEVESLRRENQSLSVSANSLVTRLERLVFDGTVNATEEWSVENEDSVLTSREVL